MDKRKTMPVRLPMDIIEDLNKSLDERFRNKLITRKELKFPEGLRLIRRMPEWNLALEKLKKLPKKEDL